MALQNDLEGSFLLKGRGNFEDVTLSPSETADSDEGSEPR